MIVKLGTSTYEYAVWDGKLLGQVVAVDTETAMIDGPAVPELALMTAYDGSGTVWLVHLDRVADFISGHAASVLVFHNVAFDFHVLYQHMINRDEGLAAAVLMCNVIQNRCKDTMILDQLVRLAAGQFPVRRNLAELSEQYARIFDLDKEDPYRLRYGEIIGQDWQTVDPGFWEYAAKDAVATYAVYNPLRQLAHRIVQHYKVPAEAIRLHGMLTQDTQVKAAIALAAVTYQGICLDQDKRANVEQGLRQEMDSLVQKIKVDYPGVFKIKHDNLWLTPSGKPKVNNGELTKVLVRIAEENDITIPVTEKTGKPSLARSFWNGHQEDPFVATWVKLDEISKLIQFFAGLQENTVHPQYETLVRTGRTSCRRPNVQQIPRSGNLREMFVPAPGHYLLAIDYAALELRTLASNCERLFGRSVLADVIRSGVDPHAYTAALMLDMSQEDFGALKKSDPEKYKSARQKAKAVNFGIPGGLGARKLVTYAKVNYGVDMTLDEASIFRERFLNEVYPEIGLYMANDLVDVLADNLCIKKNLVLAAFEESTLLAAKRVVRGTSTKRDGTPYKDDFVENIWSTLGWLNRNEVIRNAIKNREGSEWLEKQLFFGAMVTSTGMVRGASTFTQRKNGPFQSDAAIGAKLALWDLYLHQYRVVAFVHDEFLIELPEGSDYRKEAEDIEQIICKAMQRVTGNVPIAAEYTLAHKWSKSAKLLKDETGQLIPWGDDK